MSDMDQYIKLASLPDEMKKEVNDLINHLKSKIASKQKNTNRREAGLAKGLIEMKEGFDEPLVDFKEYMK